MPNSSLASPPAYRQAGVLDPSALAVEDLARLLGLSADTIRRHVAEGAPAAADGPACAGHADRRMNLVHYAAWLNRRLKERDGD
jgi:hypothetical protein